MGHTVEQLGVGSAPRRGGGSVQLVKDIQAAFAKPMDAPGVSPIYILGVGMVAASAMAIAVTYLGIVCAIVGTTLYHALHDITDSAGSWGGARSAGSLSIRYYLVLVLGVALSVLFIKPLIAPPVEREVGPSFQPQEQPELFALIRCIADALGVRAPQRVDFDNSVNASAGFRRGWRSLFASGDLVMTLGLPLVATMSVQDLGGLIAHELGHCRQGFSTRLHFVSLTIIEWFCRVIQEKDRWDDRLAEVANSQAGFASGYFDILRIVLSISTFFLSILLRVHLLLTSFMSRQMEFDADRFAGVIAGSNSIAPAVMQISLLSDLQAGAIQDMFDRLGRGRIYDNWPEYLATRLGLLTPETRRPMEKAKLEERRGLFSTHPSLTQTFKAASRQGSPGVLHSQVPARELVRDFRRQCKLATFAMYRSLLGRELDQFTLVPTEPFIEELEKQGSRRKVLSRFLAGVYDPFRFPRVQLDSLATTTEPRELMDRLRDVRQRYAEGLKTLQQVLDRTLEAESMLVRTLAVRVIHRSREPIAIAILGEDWQNEAKVFELATHAKRDLALQCGALGEFEDLVSTRLVTVIQLLAWMAKLGQPPGGPQLLKAMLPDVESLNRLASVQRVVIELSILVYSGSIAVSVGEATGELQGTLGFHAATTLGPDPDAIKHVRSALLPSATPARSGAPRLGEELDFTHHHRESSDLLVTVDRLCQTWRDQYEEVFSRLVGAIEQVEKMLSLEPLPPLAEGLYARQKVTDPASIKRA